MGSLPAVDDRFGDALTTGDFDGDGHDDLVVAAPLEDVGRVDAAGMVHVLRGTTLGVTGVSSRSFTQATPGIGSDPEPGDTFGAALSALPPAAH